MLIGQIYFYMLAILAIAGALVTVLAKNPIRCAMGLLGMIVCIAGLFLALHAEFLAVTQLIVYAGAIVVLFIFVIMLLGPSATMARDHRGRLGRTVGGVVFGASAAGAVALVAQTIRTPTIHNTDHDFGTIDAFGRSLFAVGFVPFELSSALLMVAVVGAVAVARGKQPDPRLHGKDTRSPSGRELTETPAVEKRPT